MHRLTLLTISLLLSVPAVGQNNLTLVRPTTQVEAISFRFVENPVLDEERLLEQISTRAPGFRDNLRSFLDFIPGVDPGRFPFDPLELQRDMVRLRRYYAQNGFLKARVDYPATQFDPETNRIRVIITIREGPPLSVRERTISGEDRLPEAQRTSWARLANRLPLKPGARYTEFDRLRLASEARRWLRDRGFAFADVNVTARVDSLESLVDVRMDIDPRPLAYFGDIEFVGQESVTREVLLRQLPFRTGDLFSASKVSQGQRALFGLDLFRVAVAEIPEQAEGDSVLVRFLVREAEPRYVTARTGYSRENGMALDGEWRHRNFLGGARQLSLGSALQTGLLASPPAGRAPVRSVSSRISLRQPNLLLPRVSGNLSVFHNYVQDDNQQTEYHEVGVSPAALYELYAFRTLSASYSFSRAFPVGSSSSLVDARVFNRSVFSANWTIGRLNDYLNPRRGLIVRPSLELAGLLVATGFSYLKGGVEGTGYLPLTSRSGLVLTGQIGNLKPLGGSRDQTDPVVEYRFDPIRYYAGGANDVRGWALNSLGPRFARADSVYVDDQGNPTTDNARFEPVGALGKVRGSIELRVPIPGLGDKWRLGTFLDAGALASRLVTDDQSRVQFLENGQPAVEDQRLPALSDLRFGTGAGVRYRTPVGSVRLDIAFKINPDDGDLQSANDVVLFREGLLSERPDTPFRRRFNLHLSIDRAF